MPADAVVLSADDAADLSDRIYQVRCAAEDVATALDERDSRIKALEAEIEGLRAGSIKHADLP